jgi:hypothetical protein
MAYNVKFVRGTQNSYTNLATKDDSTLYFITDANKLYLGSTLIADKTDLSTVEANIGTLTSLETTDKSSLVAAINEAFSAASNAATNDKVTITSASGTGNNLTTYTISQGGTEIGKINIPKDLVVSAGEVVTNPDDQHVGTFIKLTIANQTTPIYINVADLVDAYTAAANATQVQVAISDTNVVSATIVADGVGSTELAANAVTTAKITDKNVTKAKLAEAVQTSLGKADTAVQTVVSGSTNGTISVDGSDVSVKGLGSAAYTASSAYDAAGAASAVLGTTSDASTANTVYGVKAYAKSYADGLASNYDAAGTANTAIQALDATVTQTAASSNGNVAATVKEVDGKLTSVSVSIAANTYDSYGAAASSLSDAKSYTDTALTWTTL